MIAKDLREKSLEDLKELEKSTMKEVFQTRFKNFTNRLDDTSMIKKTRRDLARIRTILGERTRGATPAPATEKRAAKVKPAKQPKAPKAEAKAADAPEAAPSKPASTKAKAAKKSTKKSEAK